MNQSQSTCCSPPNESAACSVESIITVDERGQMVLPKDVRERAGIEPGAKLALATWKKDGQVCCITLIPIAELSQRVGEVMGPLFAQVHESSDISKEKTS